MSPCWTLTPWGRNLGCPSAQLCTRPACTCVPPTPLDSPTAEHRVEARLAADDRAARDRHVETVRAYQAKSVEAAEALAAILDGQLYVESGSFEAFAQSEFGIRRRRAYQLAAAGRTYAMLRDAGVTPLPRSEAQLRPLTALDGADDRRAAWERALAGAGGDARRITMESVEYAVGEVTGHHGTSAAPLSDDVALAVVERSVDRGAPTEKLQAEHRGLLGLLHPEDQATIWTRARLDGDAAGKTEYDADDRLKKVPSGAVKRAVRGLAAGLAEDVVDRGPQDPAGLAVLLEKLLVGDELPAGTPEVGGSYLVPYAGSEGFVASLVQALDDHGGITEERPDDTDEDREERRSIRARRKMIRCRLEPDVAAWSWAVLAPAARRSATAWIPDPDAPPPCYVPARLTQPANTRPKTLDTRTPTARTVLLAPGVDLFRDDVPSDVVESILERAGAAGHLAFLVATNHPDRLTGHSWSSNVVPAVSVQGPPKDTGSERKDERPDVVGAIARALDGFETAGVRGALVLDDCRDTLPNDLLVRVRDHVRVVVLRGSATGQRLYDQALALRPAGVLMVATSTVRCRPWDALLVDVADRPERAAVAVAADLPRPSAR